MERGQKDRKIKVAEKKHLASAQTWGLTGGIASGKSTVGQYFRDLGIPVLDADQISRNLSEPGGAAYPLLIQRFNTNDRSQLRKLAFSDAQVKLELEALLHPLIVSESKKQLEQLTRNHSIVIYEATLLIETHRSQDFDGLILVESSAALQKERLIQRSGISETLADCIINEQIARLSLEKRRSYADILIVNDQSLDALRNKVHELAIKNCWIK